MTDSELFSSEMCRCCLARNTTLSNIFANEIVDGDIMPLSDVYRGVTLLPLRIDDNLPAKICANCSAKLVEQYLFKQKCEKSSSLLHRVHNFCFDKSLKQSIETQTEEVHLISSSVQTEVTNDETLVEFLTGKPNDDFIHFEIESDEIDDAKLTEENVEYILEDDEKSCEIEIDDSTETNCLYCGKQFNDRIQLRDHLNEHIEILPLLLTSANLFRCSRCRFVFPAYDSFKVHLAQNHCELKSIDSQDENCTDYQFLGHPITDNMDHIAMFSCHTNENQLIACEFCDTETNDIEKWFEHFNDDHLLTTENTEELYLNTMNLNHWCGICHKTCINLKDIIFHVYFHQKKFYCPFGGCSNEYDNFAQLNGHIARDHFIDAKLQCEQCEFETKSYVDLKKHQRYDCAERNFKCNFCGKKFIRKNSLVAHQRRIHFNLKKFQCETCGKGFAQSTDLKNHVRTHTNERPYECPICDKSFRTLSNRTDHVATHNDEYKFRCEICKKEFKSERVLRGHSKIHSSERNFVCEICNKKFIRRYHLTVHLQHHNRPDKRKTKK